MPDLVPVDAHIHRAPPGNKFVSRIPVKPLPSPDPTVREMLDMEHAKPDYYWRKVNQVSDGIVAELRKQLGDRFPDHRYDLYADLLFGPFRLDFNTFSDRVKPGELGKEASARIQHNLVHNLFHGATEGADLQFSDNMFKVLKMHHDLHERSPIRFAASLESFWRGVKSELAVVKVLAESGYSVVLPNYADAPNDFGMAQEVLDWDVRSGVDLIAAKHGQAYLLDVKGILGDREESADGAPPELRNHVSIFQSQDRNPKSHQWEGMPQSLREAISYLSPNRDWRRGTIVIPTAREYVHPFRDPPAGTSARAELQRFATFTDRNLPNSLLQGIIRLQAF